MTALPLYHHTSGSGPRLILLHGLGSSADDWELQVPAFSQHYTVTTLDLRGHKRSPAPGERPSFTISQMADDVAALIETLPDSHGLTPPHILGLSLGGCVALSLAHRHPRLVRSLVLVNSLPRFQLTGLRGLVGLLKRMWLFVFKPMPALAASVARSLFPFPEQRQMYEMAAARLGQNSKKQYGAAMRAIAASDLRRYLPTIRCPAFIVAGDRDRTVPRSGVEALRRALPQARFALVRNSGHATPLDQTETFNRLVLNFLNDLEWAGRRKPVTA